MTQHIVAKHKPDAVSKQEKDIALAGMRQKEADNALGNAGKGIMNSFFAKAKAQGEETRRKVCSRLTSFTLLDSLLYLNIVLFSIRLYMYFFFHFSFLLR